MHQIDLSFVKTWLVRLTTIFFMALFGEPPRIFELVVSNLIWGIMSCNYFVMQFSSPDTLYCCCIVSSPHRGTTAAPLFTGSITDGLISQEAKRIVLPPSPSGSSKRYHGNPGNLLNIRIALIYAWTEIYLPHMLTTLAGPLGQQ